ncbi:TPA: hypothetical protein N3Z88_005151 [Klebsiella quasipneumoniae subsp. similipneumoniae]|nr:hypothetical protein [Klebsiella quasipneumoniae]HCM2947789.1 hypothetical protein [Klebsiella quasipneumoniae subsp. similipneumoniae]HCM6337627.1 hypothetical protein [Klebsiella quasipneumoniae subsp. similipneumoniae]
MADIKEIVDSVKDILIDPLKDEVKYRARNNFFGSFIVSWFFWNWDRVAYFIFSTDPIMVRILTAKNLFPLEQGQHWYIFWHSHSLVWPLATATTFVLLYPTLMLTIALIHKRVTRSISILNETKELERMTRNVELVKQNETNEGERAKIKAKTEREIAENAEAAVKARLNIQEITKQYAEIETKVKTLKLERDGLDTIIINLQKRRDDLNEELIIINGEYGPIKSANDKYQKILNDNAVLNVEFDKLKNKYDSLDEDFRDYRRAKDTEITNLQAAWTSSR